MKWFSFLLILLGIILSAIPSVVRAEILAMLNYKSKPQQTMRREGIAIIDMDPASANFGAILVDIPLPPNLVNHHIFYNKDASKAYLTALGQSDMHVMDMTRYPYRIRKSGCLNVRLVKILFFQMTIRHGISHAWDQARSLSGMRSQISL